ncbi:ATP-binding protein [Marinilabiliaceae bacterium JC017]|nr:ATP-binding protein [Marinilabiliaceae bacterium JC017]
MPNPQIPPVRSSYLFLESSIDWFSQVLEVAIQLYFNQDCPVKSIYEITPPKENVWDEVISGGTLSFDERLILLLGLMPHVRPQILDTFFIHNKNFDRPFTEFGGWKGNTHGGFLPTGETAAFILAGTNLEKRFDLLKLFDPEHLFARKNILKIESSGEGEPFLSGALRVSGEFLTRLCSGEEHKPDYSISFPAKRVTTPLDWENLVLSHEVLEDIEDINTWIRGHGQIMDNWGLRRIIKPGYRCLFYGPPGTGKTLTATLLGKRNQMDVYRIDLSMVVSKYIGETEKNLANVFDQAENKNWILFFDEADALFGKRTQAGSSNDRHANQEVAYLLQRIEDFPGIVILATNLKSNIDEAFARRFQSVIYFPVPDSELRRELWSKMLPGEWIPDGQVDLGQLASEFELSGGAMTNVVRFCALKLLARQQEVISMNLLLEGVRKELYKEGKMI